MYSGGKSAQDSLRGAQTDRGQREERGRNGGWEGPPVRQVDQESGALGTSEETVPGMGE